MSERISKDMSERMSEDMSEDMRERVSKDMSERMSEDMSERMSEDMSERLSERMSKDMSKKIVKKTNQKEWEKISQKECQKICQKECEKISQKECRKICVRKTAYTPERMLENMSERICTTITFVEDSSQVFFLGQTECLVFLLIELRISAQPEKQKTPFFFFDLNMLWQSGAKEQQPSHKTQETSQFSVIFN